MFGKCRRHVVMCHIAKAIAFTEVEHPKFGSADASCARQHALEYRLQLAGRTADDLQDLGSRGLLLQRLAQIVRALAQLVEQPSVPDGDDGLRGKILKQRDLPLGTRQECTPVEQEIAGLIIGPTDLCDR